MRVMLHCNTKLIGQPSHASADSNANVLVLYKSPSIPLASWSGLEGSSDIVRILRPTLERRASRLGQDIDTALGALEPAINIVQENFSGVGYPRANVAHALRALR